MSNSHLPILRKLLWSKKSNWLLAGAAFGAFTGLWMLLSAVQFHLDVKRLLEGDANPGDLYVQVNKKVNLFNTLGVKSSFDRKEIERIREQPFVEKVGVFTANDFKVGAYSDMLGFYTELFFESVPDEFLDVDESSFRWSEGQKDLPIIISRDYLALYNFGFAPSQSLPQITPNTIKRLAMDVRLSGNGRNATFQGRIAGFSDRINSILVPPTFMKWSNETFGSGEPVGAARLILKVDNPLSKAFQEFLKKSGYEVSSGRLIGSQFGVLLRLILVVIAGFGLLILVLSVLIFLLIFQLLVAQGAEDIRLLLQIGYAPKFLINKLNRKFLLVFGGVMILVFLALLGGRILLGNYFEKQGFPFEVSLHTWVWLLGTGLAMLLFWLNMTNIRRSVFRLT
jgi:hypothetical protein